MDRRRQFLPALESFAPVLTGAIEEIEQSFCSGCQKQYSAVSVQDHHGAADRPRGRVIIGSSNVPWIPVGCWKDPGVPGFLGQFFQAHNLKVAGSNLAPATKKSPSEQQLRLVRAGFCMYSPRFRFRRRIPLPFQRLRPIPASVPIRSRILRGTCKAHGAADPFLLRSDRGPPALAPLAPETRTGGQIDRIAAALLNLGRSGMS